jgi:hypothetical protein
LSEAIPGLSANDITLSGVTGVTKGTLSGDGPTYTLPISGFTSGGTLTVTVAKAGFNISGSHTVIIYYVKTDSDTFVRGETGPGGGKIFYVSAAGFTVQMVDPLQNYIAHYLEAAPNDMATTFAWASSAFITSEYGGTGGWVDIPGTANEIGAGRKNTALILAIDVDAPAAKACVEATYGGKTDWFLPSRYELNYLYSNRNLVGNFKTTGNMNSTTYRSSTQFNDRGAYYQDFNGGYQNYDNKNYAYSVRAVRAF